MPQTQRLLQEMRERMAAATERVHTRLATAAAGIDELERTLLALVEPSMPSLPRRRPS